jgi:hypothetical protein
MANIRYSYHNPTIINVKVLKNIFDIKNRDKSLATDAGGADGKHMFTLVNPFTQKRRALRWSALQINI